MAVDLQGLMVAEEGRAEGQSKRKSDPSPGEELCASIFALALLFFLGVFGYGLYSLIWGPGSSCKCTVSYRSTPSSSSSSSKLDMSKVQYKTGECGGVIELPGDGKALVSHKMFEDYGPGENCQWLVTTTSPELIQVKLTFIPGNFNFSRDISLSNSDYGRMQDGFMIAETRGQELKCKKLSGSDYGFVHTLKVPFIIQFTSWNYSVLWPRTGFAFELTAQSTATEDVTKMVQPPEVTFVELRKRGEVSLIDQDGQRRLPTVFTAFRTPADGIDKRTYNCSAADTARNNCCDFVSGYEIKPYHDLGEPCVYIDGLFNGKATVTSERSFVMMYNPPRNVNSSECRMTWSS